MKKLLLILLCLPMIGFGQGWIQTYGTAAMGISVQQTNEGGYIIAGTRQNDSSDVYLIKTDGNGNQQWTKTFGGGWNDMAGWGESVQQTNDGGYIVYAIKDWDDLREIWLIKTNSVGNLLWEERYGLLNCGVRAMAFNGEQTADGGYILAGQDWGSYGIKLIKTNSQGDTS